MISLRTIVISYCFLFLVACSSTYIVSEYGDASTIVFLNGGEIECEIIFFNDTSVIFSERIKSEGYRSLQKNSLYYINHSEIESISISGFDGSDWGTSVMLFQVLPVGLLVIAAISEDVSPLPVVGIFGIPAILSAIIFKGSEEERPMWKASNLDHNIDKLNIYSRFPNGLSNKQLLNLLELRNQKKVKKYDING